ncbi:hypothetical protein ACQ4PT_068414 [Festuca glaucescens]
MTGRLAVVPELSTTGFTAASAPFNLYRESIQRVAVYGGHTRTALFSQSGHRGSSYSSDSGASSSYLSNNSGSSTRSVSALTAEFDSHDHELTRIARRMVGDGYIWRMVRAFEYSGGPDRALENWFFELGVDWVLQIHDGHGSERQLQFQLQYKSESWLQDLVERWFRAFIIILVSIKEVAFAVQETLAVARFGKASISAMLVFVNAVVPLLKAEKLRAVVHMYICVAGASPYMFTTLVICPEAQSIFNEIGCLLEREGNRLSEIISGTMNEVRTLVEDDDSWAEIAGRGGDVHRNTRFMVDCIVSMRMAQDSTKNSVPSDKTENLGDLIDDSLHYLKGLLLRKSELCSDQSLRYLFLLNNSYFIAQVFEPSTSLDRELRSLNHWRPTPECDKYMDSYLHVSWGHVLSSLSCIPKSKFPGVLRRWKWNNTSPVSRFRSAFHKTYQAQRFWKVPAPQLRDALHKAIAKRVISGYRDYLEEHPEELEKHVSSGSSSPDVLEEMLGELFEG